ncbi:hypothetical protein HPB50_011450 [Hyalomma asiaticum]|uniref:Uncharacterized protein n=1 Tax=Hyalomma asiaticum TaxID=266040 RepID=A0ACB7SQ49_HYAAI|nr:hypothetical protein HPB50_011450 [Hyalomma asiaticum]
MRATQRPCALLLALLCISLGPWKLLHQYVRAYDPCVYPGAHLEAMFRCAMKSMPDDVTAEVQAIINRIPGLQLREVVDLMCKANRQSGTVMAAMRKLLSCCILLLFAVDLVRSQEPASCFDRRVLLNTGKEYLKSLVAKLIPKYVKDYITGLPQEEFKGMREVQDYP